MATLYYKIPPGDRGPCKFCSAPLAWVTTRQGRMPLDLRHRRPGDKTLAEPHWAFCSHADEARKAKRTRDLGQAQKGFNFEEGSRDVVWD